MTREPLVSVASITAAVTAVVGLLVAFGLTLTDGQTTAILGVVAILAPLVVALAVRGKVTPTADPRADDGTELVPRGGEL